MYRLNNYKWEEISKEAYSPDYRNLVIDYELENNNFRLYYSYEKDNDLEIRYSEKIVFYCLNSDNERAFFTK